MERAGRAILHVDMDAFYASVEIRERPELAERPVIVGGTPEGRGVVCAANYVARRYGIHSAMPAAMARRLCPQGVFLPPRHRLYAQVSRDIHAIFERYTPMVEPLSLDEAFLDVTASERLFGPAERIARRIKDEIRQELGLVASVGVAPNKFIAKIASDIDKPDGFCVVHAEQVQGFLDPLPVTRLWGVGKVTEKIFSRLGIRTIGQFRAWPPALVHAHFGHGGTHLLALAHGRDDRPVEAGREVKSISHETTFARDIGDREILAAWLLDLTDQVAGRLRAHGLAGRTVQIKVRYADFTTVTRAQSLRQPTDATDVLWAAARELFETRLPAHLPPVRLLGMGVSGFDVQDSPAQGDLIATAPAGNTKLDAVTDSIRERFGPGALRRGGAARARRGRGQA
ncbi:MAG: DNA polymerase IV [Thiohalomonadaceae bacterium]